MTTPRPNHFLKSWLKRVAQELNDLGKYGALSKQWFLNGCWNKNSKLHARVLGALVRAVDKPFVPLVEVKLGNFRPDLFVIKPTPKSKDEDRIAIVEYESTNSSDPRIWLEDLPKFKRAIRNYEGPVPAWWILVTTLPDCCVSNWPWRYGGKGKAICERNPLAHYQARIENAFKGAWKRTAVASCHLAWVNLMPSAIKLLSLDGEARARPWTVRLSLPKK